MSERSHSEILSKLPGPVEIAGLFGIRPQAVSNWRRRGVIPRGYIPFLRDKYPDAFCGVDVQASAVDAENGQKIEMAA
jgi:hypothetical protein